MLGKINCCPFCWLLLTWWWRNVRSLN